MSPEKAVMCWSGGKDSSYCLHKVLSENLFEVKYLLTTVNSNYNRVSMHGIREEFIDRQSGSIGIPSIKVRIREGNNHEYENAMSEVLLNIQKEGINTVIFGDIFLEDLREYRENNLSKINMRAVFPLWKINTTILLTDFIQKGFESVICCVNEKHLSQEWVGRKIDTSFLNELPVNTDPCGENGEYHSFCYKGPVFRNEIKFLLGEKTFKTYDDKEKSGFWFIDMEQYAD